MIFLDIETVPQQPENEAKATIAETIEAPGTMKKAETIADWHDGAGKYAGVKDAAIEEAYRKTSFDGAKGEICSIAWGDDKEIFSASRDSFAGEGPLLEFFLEKVGAFTTNYFIGHNIRFDLKFLYHRCIINRISDKHAFHFGGRHNTDFYCTMEAWAGFKERISQDNLCKALGIEGKPDDIDGSKVWDHYKEGKIARIEEYNRYDVETVRQIYNRLNFI